MREIEEEAKREQEGLEARVEQLQDELQHHINMLSSFQERYRELEMAFERERQSRQIAEAEIKTLRKGMQGGIEAVASPKRRERGQEYPKRQQDAQQELMKPVAEDNRAPVDVTCGRCNGSTRCQCIEEAFEMANIAVEGGNDSNTKRPHSPPLIMDNKRMCQESAENANEGNEIDFTTPYATQRAQNNTIADSGTSSIPAMAHFEPCGFCRDGDVCICAALAAEAEQPSPAAQASAPRNIDTMDAGLSISCTNNPGSCAQCRSDPNSTLFCKTLAATRNISGVKPNYPLPNSSYTVQAPTRNTSGALQGPTLSCADAYTTLSRHHAFSQASTELGTWMSHLTAVPGNANTAGKTAFEIEAASVMSVLRFFDTRFGEKPSGADGDGCAEVKEGM